MEKTISDTVITLADNRLYALAQPYILDERPVSTHPHAARGFSQYNCYLVLEGDQALLIDTGIGLHEATIIAALDALLAPTTTLSLMVLRISEFASLSNARALADRYNIGSIMAAVGLPPEDLHKWLDLTGAWREPTGGGKLAAAGRLNLTGRHDIPIGPRHGANGRALEIVRQKLQFIPTTWLYDSTTGTMFTSDVFTHVWRETSDGPWVVDEIEDVPSIEQVSNYLIETRYWWLAGAKVKPIREDLVAIRESHEIECIAPAFGCVLRGRAVVDHHLDLMDQALLELSERPPIGVDLVPFYEESR